MRPTGAGAEFRRGTWQEWPLWCEGARLPGRVVRASVEGFGEAIGEGSLPSPHGQCSGRRHVRSAPNQTMGKPKPWQRTMAAANRTLFESVGPLLRHFVKETTAAVENHKAEPSDGVHITTTHTEGVIAVALPPPKNLVTVEVDQHFVPP